MFSPNEIRELVEIVQKQHLLFIAQHVGVDILSDKDKQVLESFGLDIDTIETKPLSIETAFKFGILSRALGTAAANKLSFRQLKQGMLNHNFLPLSYNEKSTIKSIKYQAYSDITGLGNRISADLNSIIIESDRQQRLRYQALIKDEAIKTAQNRLSVRDMVSELGHKTNDWNRDFGRISDFILHSAFDEGRISGFERMGVQKVYKDVFPGACKHCLRLYTEDGVIGSKPKIFTVAELRGNGNNVGRKTIDWKPVIGSTHPWCRCTSQDYPEGYDWNPVTRDFDIPSETYKSPIERRGKVRVQVGNETSFV